MRPSREHGIFCAVVLAALAASTNGAAALQITQSFNYFLSDSISSTTPTSSSAIPLGDGNGHAVNLFDPTLGTLNEAQIVIFATIDSHATAHFTDPISFPPDLSQGGIGVLDAQLTFSAPDFAASRTVSDRSDTCKATIPFGPCTASFGSNPVGIAPVSFILHGPALNDYVGNGSFAFLFGLNGSLDVGRTLCLVCEAVSYSGTLSSTGTISVFYEFNPPAPPPADSVPEPASIVLFGTALAGLGAGVRKRRG